ncbi:MAG TPA: DUF1579 family protein [Anaerolineae bacterium]
MEMPRPLPEQQALAIRAGDWVGKEHVHPSPFDIAGGPAIGRTRNKLALDGFAILHDYEQERNGAVHFRAHGIFHWDSLAHQYVLYWFDSFGMPPSMFRGTLQSGVLLLTCPQGTGFSRVMFDFSRAGTYQYRLEVSVDGREWSTFTDGVYTKQ